MGGPDIAITIDDPERGLPPSKINHDQHQHGTPNTTQGGYRDQKVVPKLIHRPWLNILDEFLDPTIESFQKSQKHRLLHFDVEVIHICASGEVSLPIPCKGANGVRDFKDAISTVDSNRCGTLVITEDISLAMIDALGTKYDLEPEFFACHLEGTQAFRTGSWQSPTVQPTVRAPNVLNDYLRKAPYYTAEFQRPYLIEGGHKEIENIRSAKTSTPRGAQLLNRVIPDAFISEKISVYKKRGENFGVILTDKLLSRVPPASFMRDVVTLDDDPDTLPETGRLKQLSCREELVAWIRRLKPEEAKALFSDHEPLVLRPVLKIIERTSATFLENARHIINRIDTGHSDNKFPDSIPFFLTVCRSLYWHIRDQQRLLSNTMRIISLRGCEKNMAEQIQDFKYLREDMEKELGALEEDVRFIVSVASIKEGKAVGLVSKLAFYFLPLSLLATILTISDDNLRFYILGGLSVPFILVSTYFMFHFKPSNIDSLDFTPIKS